MPNKVQKAREVGGEEKGEEGLYVSTLVVAYILHL